MHNWWCLQSGHNASLSCQRHELQQRHREAANASQMERVKAQLEALLAEAAAECAAPPARPPATRPPATRPPARHRRPTPRAPRPLEHRALAPPP